MKIKYNEQSKLNGSIAECIHLIFWGYLTVMVTYFLFAHFNKDNPQIKEAIQIIQTVNSQNK